ncbi:unnamed protein product [Adineta ricciae]|uniref:Peptidase M12A domain-containing protein n=1 Tax=Adineta ricciae TaxID=249248 RepID=A0A815PN04_ADIRI|nr:unnamed protein product [Adineta ricciae]
MIGYYSIYVAIIALVLQISGFPTGNKTYSKLKRPIGNPQLIEGDMLFHPALQSVPRGVAVRDTGVIWTNGIIPYQIDPNYTPERQALIVNTMRKMERLVAINNVVCIQFRPKQSSDRYFIEIVDGLGCSSYVGQSIHEMSSHIVTLNSSSCFMEGMIIHELLHTLGRILLLNNMIITRALLGFYHEQSRPDRDNYIRVLYGNILTDEQRNFEKYDNKFLNTFNTSYDYSSIMHYGRYVFSSNDLPTIEPLQANVIIGQRNNMSSTDILEVRLLYNCSAIGVTLPEINITTARPGTTLPSPVVSSYSNALTRHSLMYNRDDVMNKYYYDAVNINVPVTGTYHFKCISNIDTFGYLYMNEFDPEYISNNLINKNDDDGKNAQFLISHTLYSSVTYILISTTSNPYTTGSFAIEAVGPAAVNFNTIRISSSYNRLVYSWLFTTTFVLINFNAARW